MAIFDSCDQLPEIIPGLCLGHATFSLNKVKKLTPADIFHDNKYIIDCVLYLIQPNNIGVVEVFQESDLPFNFSDHFCSLDMFLIDNLYRDFRS
jgi:hypothetical protein